VCGGCTLQSQNNEVLHLPNGWHTNTPIPPPYLWTSPNNQQGIVVSSSLNGSTREGRLGPRFKVRILPPAGELFDETSRESFAPTTRFGQFPCDKGGLCQRGTGMNRLCKWAGTFLNLSSLPCEAWLLISIVLFPSEPCACKYGAQMTLCLCS